MTLHQLTQSAGFDFDTGLLAALRRITATVEDWRAQHRLDVELAQLDHREQADLAWRR